MIMDAWKMPEVSLGDTVLYRPHEGAPAQMAFVSKVGQDTLELWALSPGYGGVEKSSVHHKDDPRLETSVEWKKFGIWESRPRDPRLAQLSERLSALERAAQGNKK
jgi:hypothetical protein